MPASRPVTKTTTRGAARTQYAKVPRKTVAEDPAAYSKTPHEYGDVLIRPDDKGRTKLGGALQRDLVYWIERHTWGKNIGSAAKVERPEFAKLSLSQLAKLCGSDRRSVARSLADLAERGIIEARDRQGCGPTVAKMYKLTPARWKKAPWYKPPTLAEETDADAEEVTTAEESPEIEASAAPEATVEPGRVSKPQPVAVSLSKGAPAVTVRISYRSVDFPFPVAFSARPGHNGRLQVSCRATTLHRFASPSPIKSVVSVESVQVTAYRTFVSEFVLNFWGKSADESLISSIVSAAGAAPVEVFERIVLQKFKRSHTGKNHSTGLLPVLAADAARAWQEMKTAEARRPAPTTLNAEEMASAEKARQIDHARTEADKLKCGGCGGTGKRESGIKGVFKKCGICHGSGKKQ
jgi:hypothetical protein